MDKKQITNSAISFFGGKYYSLLVRTDDLLVFQDDVRDYNPLALFVLFILGIAPAILYYELSPKGQVTISFATASDDLIITVAGNTKTSKNYAQKFRDTLTRQPAR